MAERGANLEDLEQLHKAINNLHRAIGLERPKITRSLDGAYWKGPFADKFRSAWKSDYEKALIKISDALADAAKAVKESRDAIEAATR